ncbi:transcription antitermination factor NusB [Dankookia rubra]|uniref:Transcription antitermination protein NusB n=2 Tax=Dankookia rubra TaxID=1442381 RepID=A0A4R5QFS3_9PROT|nr:transcription antitermination factor NusB [Dankookia rubra]
MSELDRLRAEHEAEQRAQQTPAQPPRPPATGQAPAGAAPKPGRKPSPPKPRGRPRTGARVAAVQALFQSEQNNEPAEVVVSQFQRHRLGTQPGDGGFEEGRVPEADAPLFSSIVMLVARNAEAVDKTVAAHLDPSWPLGKLDPVLRALLRAACAELREPPAAAPPAKVLINEYLDIAHGFFGGDEPRFANGVLDAMARSVRAEEFAGPPRRRGG